MNMDIIYVVVSYMLVIFIGFFVMNFLTNGYVLTYILIKLSRGKKILCIVKGLVKTYYKIGYVQEEFLRFKDNAKQMRRYNIKEGDAYRLMGIDAIEINEKTNEIIRKDSKLSSGFDPIKMDGFVERALVLPRLNSKTQEKLMLILIILLLLGVGFLIWNQVQLGATIETLGTKGVI